MRFVSVCILAAFCLLVPVAVVSAQQEEPASEPGPAAAEFQRILTEFRDLLADLAVLQKDFREADAEKQAEIRVQWADLTAKGKTMKSQLVDAAEKAYAEAPNADPEVTKLLVDALIGHVHTRGKRVQTDDYAAAQRIGQLLVDNDCPEAPVYNWAGIAAFANNDFDTAGKYFAAAEQNGVLQEMGGYYSSLVPYYKEEWAKEQKIRAEEAKADDLPRVLLKTSAGDITIELFENEAPMAVANFISLVEKGFYNGLTFHRVLPGFMAQGGCPDGDGTGGPGYTIPCECYQPNHRKHFQGSLSMAHAGRDTGGSQFFLTFLPTRQLDGKHTVFGRVIEGLDVLPKITRRDPQSPAPPEPDKIIEATVLRKREHEYVPTKSQPFGR